MTQADAIDFCAGLDHGHGLPYALPTVQQFVGVLKYAENSPALPKGVFSNAPTNARQFWTSTPFVGNSIEKQAYVVQIAGGQVPQAEVTATRAVWCVQAHKKGHKGYQIVR